MNEAQERIRMSRWMTFVFFAGICLFYAGIAGATTAPKVYSYICSDDHVYSLRVTSSKPSGFTARGPWHKIESFCHASAVGKEACLADKTPETLKCYAEFKEKSSVSRMRGAFAVWPSNIRHAPNTAWFEFFKLSPKITAKCALAVQKVACKKPNEVQTTAQQLKCVYDKSSFANRSVGRECFKALNAQLSQTAKVERVKMRSTQSQIAKR